MASTGVPALDQAIAAASAKYGVPADVLTGIWRIESGSSYPNQFVNKEGYGGLFGTTMWNAPPAQQADYAASILANLVHETGSLPAALLKYSGGGYSSVDASGRTASLNGGTTGPAAQTPGFTAQAPGAPTDVLAQLLLQNGGAFPQAKTIKASNKNPVVKVNTKPPADLANALTVAKKYLASTKGGFSNAGFAQYVHSLRGAPLPSSARGQYRATRPTTTPKAGDLVFGKGGQHRGVLIDGNTVLHGGGAVLKVSSLANQSTAGLVAVRMVDGANPVS